MQVRTFYKVIAFWFPLMTNSKRNMIFNVRRFTNKRADNLLATWTQFQNGLFYAMYWQTWTFSHVLDRKKMVHSYNIHTCSKPSTTVLFGNEWESQKGWGWLVGRSVGCRERLSVFSIGFHCLEHADNVLMGNPPKQSIYIHNTHIKTVEYFYVGNIYRQRNAISQLFIYLF